MKTRTLIQAAVVAAAVAVPALSFAQEQAPLTRAEVRADLVRVEQAGYNPATAGNATYPADIQAAEARIASTQADSQAADTGYGPSTSGSSQSGQLEQVTPHDSVYFGH
ncbi:hypothetical protein CY652_02275 [Burkholderia sp. WAC0059]|uniref:DUF4148 domain-containing protein n=1 Tax=Burkholderia sp. WAC0059 TaxID=2066022 RepID=UPI000C7EFED0|nr:DUF4148 domain-containing protein [Burkholderia sp. WAC0059]PLZ03826.1 hypothetical protein CY652_02275 [Burkholderia sp. WAC0059]